MGFDHTNPPPTDRESASPTTGLSSELASGVARCRRGDQRPLVTDGGQLPESPEDDQKQLQDLFFSVTGTDEITEQQEADDRRFVVEQPEESLAVDVADVAREDGLDDTLPKPNNAE